MAISIIVASLGLMVVSTSGQTTEPPTTINACYRQAQDSFAFENPTCSGELTGGLSATKEALDTFCPRQCAVEANTFFEDACGIAISEILCTRNEDNANTTYCVTSDETSSAVSRVINGACSGVNCSNPFCDAAVQNLTCCATTIRDYVEGVTGNSELFPELPGNCMTRQCMTPSLGPPSPPGSGGSAIIAAVPCVILLSMLTALVL